MTRTLFLIWILVPILTSAQTLSEKDVWAISPTSQSFPSELGSVMEYVSSGKSLYRLTSAGMDLLQKEDYFIWSIDHYISRGRLLYTYGTSDTTYPAILDLAKKEKKILGNSIIEASKGMSIVSFGESYWIDDNTFASIVLLQSGKKGIITYDPGSRSFHSLVLSKNIDNLRVGRREKVITYRETASDLSQYHIYNLEKREDRLLSSTHYSQVIPLGSETYLGITNDATELFDKKGKVISRQEYDISGILYYNEEQWSLVALLKRDEVAYEFRYGVYLFNPSTSGEMK